MTARRPLGPGPATAAPSVRDASAVAAASGYTRHGETALGGSFTTCRCPKEPCGGTDPHRYRDDCPEHGGGRSPVQHWHWAAECPGRTCRECGAPYVPGAGQGHREACSQF